MKKLLIALTLLASSLWSQTAGTNWSQIKAGDRHGTSTKGQSSDGTGTSGNVPKFNASGGLTDSGVAAAALGTVTSVTLAGTSGQITVTGTCTVSTTGTCTFSLPSALALPGTINKLTLTAPATGATLTIADGKTLTANNSVIFSGTDGSTLTFGAGGTLTYTSNNLSVFASTTSAQLAGVLSDETGTGAAVFANSPTLVTPALGTPSSGDGTHLTNIPPAAVTSAQGNGAKFQLSTGSTTTGNCVKFDANGNTVDSGAGCGTGSGSVTNVATTSPITGGAITTTGTIACATCVTSSSPGSGVAHFAGSTQAVTSSSIVSADLNITTTSCTAPAAITAISAGGVGTCTIAVITQNSKSAAYTTVLGDGGGHIYHPGADTTARTWTIDSNANVAYPIGTAITFVNDTSGGVITIAITSDTLVLAGAGTTGSRTLAANGIATALKVTSTRWIISGTGLT